MPRQVDHASRRAEITAALWDVVRREGIDAVTVRAVAATAGVSAGRVQHYFSTKDEMLRFALRQVGSELATRTTERVAALGPSPRPLDVVRVVLVERLPLDPERRVYLQAMLAALHPSPDPELAGDLADGHRVLRDGVADRLRQAVHDGSAAPGLDVVATADGLLAAADGLVSHLLQGIHTPESARTALDALLVRIGSGQPVVS